MAGNKLLDAPPSNRLMAAVKPKSDFWQRVSETTIAHMLRDAWQGLKAPGDAWNGSLQVMDPATGHVSEDAFKRATDLAGTVTLGAGAAPRDGTVNMGIRAFHGSPHDFDRFDMSKIGTGEGNQSFGHGLYFADSEDVARSYRNSLSTRKLATGEDIDWGNPAHLAAAWTKINFGNRQHAIEYLKGVPAQHQTEAGREAVRLLESGAPLPEISKGHMYEVNIAADPEHFIDYNKPMAEQSDKVKAALGYQNFSPVEPAESIMRRAFNNQWFAGDVMNRPGSAGVASPDELRQFLADQGIPGIKYLDARSRAGWKEGLSSRNYVVFDDKLVSILRKYGWVPGMAIPAAAMMEYNGEGAPPNG